MMTNHATNGTAQAEPDSPDAVLLQAIRQRIWASDGMAITAEVWEESHGFHRWQQQYHLKHGHASGILAGLQVVASDPPSSYVNVLPGAALDSEGRLITVATTQGYDLGAGKAGWLRLLLAHTEGEPQLTRSDLQVKHVQHHFVLQASTEEPGFPCIEVARIRCVAHTGLTSQLPLVIQNAADPLHPLANEIDLRARLLVRQQNKPLVSIKVVRLGQPAPKNEAGVVALAQALNQSGRMQVSVDLPTPNDSAETLRDYTLVIALASGAFEKTDESVAALFSYVQANGQVYAESGQTGAALVKLKEMFASMGAPLNDDVTRGHPLLSAPHLFAVPPAGYTPSEPNAVFISPGERVVLSQNNYSSVWQGDRQTGAASREEIRATHEFGENLLSFAWLRRYA